MVQIDVGDAATAGFRLTFKKPLSVLTWGVLIVGYLALLLALFGAGLVNSISALARNGGAEPAPQLILSMIGSLFGFLGLMFIGLLVIGTVVIAAALRAELEPQKSAFAYMRLGGQELWVLGANVVLYIVFFAVSVVLSIPLTILYVAMGFQAAIGANGAQGVGNIMQAMSGVVGVRLLGQLVIQAVIIWLWCRLGPGVVMTFKERQFRLFESWNLTKGHAWRIFLTMLLIWLATVAMVIVAYIILIAVGVGTIASVPGLTSDPGAFFSRPLDQWIGIFGPLGIAAAIVFVVISGVSIALKWAALARVCQQLQPPSEVAETFA